MTKRVTSATMLVVFLVGSPAYAVSFDNPLASDCFADILKEIANFVVRIGIPVLVLSIIFAGFFFVTAQGNEEKLKQARVIFFWTIVGGAIILGAGFIAQMIINFGSSLGGPSPTTGC